MKKVNKEKILTLISGLIGIIVFTSPILVALISITPIVGIIAGVILCIIITFLLYKILSSNREYVKILFPVIGVIVFIILIFVCGSGLIIIPSIKGKVFSEKSSKSINNALIKCSVYSNAGFFKEIQEYYDCKMIILSNSLGEFTIPSIFKFFFLKGWFKPSYIKLKLDISHPHYESQEIFLEFKHLINLKPIYLSIYLKKIN